MKLETTTTKQALQTDGDVALIRERWYFIGFVTIRLIIIEWSGVRLKGHNLMLQCHMLSVLLGDTTAKPMPSSEVNTRVEEDPNKVQGMDINDDEK